MGARKKSYKERRERIKVSKRERRRERGPIPKNFHLKKVTRPTVQTLRRADKFVKYIDS